jgi:integral membrane protein
VAHDLQANRAGSLLALVALTSGLALGVGLPRQADRATAALWLATPAWWVTCLAGYLLLKATEGTLRDPFVLVGLFGSLAGLHGALLCATKAAPSNVARVLGLAGLGVATAAMVTRSAPAWVTVGAGAAAIAVAVAIVAALPAPDGVADPEARERLRRWFFAVARFEGLSLVAMVVIAMPLRKLTGISLDLGTGALGWGHGLLVFLFLQALQLAARGLGWSWGTLGAAFIASLVPFGTFAFEWFQPRTERLAAAEPLAVAPSSP